MSLQSNKDVYSTVEFDRWVQRSQLSSLEQFMVDRYLDRQGPTLEAGTGGGRISLGLHQIGFQNLSAFDFVPRFIEQAKAKDTAGAIDFRVGDATKLEYADKSFAQVIYFEQILSLIESEEMRNSALREAFRVLRPGGTAVFSLLSDEVRCQSIFFRGFRRWLGLLRTLRGTRRSPQLWPWVKLSGRMHWGAFNDRGPHVYWYRVAELDKFFTTAGFRLDAVGSAVQMQQGALLPTCQELAGRPLSGALYVVCHKPK